jgi:hypothetical protein
MPSVVNKCVQVAAGLLVVVLVYHMALWILHRDSLVGAVNEETDPAQKLLVLDGWLDAGAASGQSWSTINPYALSFVPLQRSANRKGGAQFSYSFWMQLNDVSPDNVAGKTLLLRGDPRAYTWTRAAQKAAGLGDALGPDPVRTTSTDVLVKCPRIRFGDTYDQLVVEFNTLADPAAAGGRAAAPPPPPGPHGRSLRFQIMI